MKIRYDHRSNCLIEVFQNTEYRHYFENNEICFSKNNGKRITKDDYKKIQLLLDKFDPIQNVRYNAKMRISQIFQDKYDSEIEKINKLYFISGFEQLLIDDLSFSNEEEPQMGQLSQNSLIATQYVQEYIDSYSIERRELIYNLFAEKLKLLNFIDNSDDIDAIVNCSLPDQK